MGGVIYVRAGTLVCQGHATTLYLGPSYKNYDTNREESSDNDSTWGLELPSISSMHQWTRTTERCINVGFLTDKAASCAKRIAQQGESREGSKRS